MITPFGIASGIRAGVPRVQTVIGLRGGILSGISFGKPELVALIVNDFYTQLETDITETFLNPNEFAEQMLYRFRTGGSKVINAIFNNEYTAVDNDSGVAVMSRDPNIIVSTQALGKNPEKGDTVLVKGKNYKVRTAEPNGIGITVMKLQVLS